ncbi:MAG: SurA N-terminal domain-containing protein [Lautropia sp.]|nr:SurA N-terminal domain-containing protein [Lautropia sp.]
MFDFVRTHQRLAQGLLLVLIMPAFVFFGIAGYDRMFSDADAVAMVDGEPVGRQQFERVYRQQVDQLQQAMGDRFDPSLLDNPAARAEVLEGLINRQALFNEARRRRITVTPAEIQKAILESVGDLRDANGKFDGERYRMVLAQNGLTPEIFEAQMAQDLALGSMENAVTQSTFVPETVLSALFDSQETRRAVRTTTIGARSHLAGLQPSEEQLKTYYDQHQADFELPESVDISYVQMKRADLLPADAQPSDAELQAYYDKHSSEYNEPEERVASHILLKLPEGADDAAKAEVRKRAESLLAEAKAKPDRFAELAKQHSDDPGSAAQGGDLGSFERDTMVKPFSDAAFALTEPGFTEVVESEYGFHVIRVTEVKGSGVKPLADVRPRLLERWREDEAARRYAEQGELLSKLAHEQADSLEPLVERFGVKILKAEKLRRRPAADAAAGSPQASARLLEQLYTPEALEERRNTAAIELEPGVLVSARVEAHNPARKQTLDEVKDVVQTRWIAEESARLAQAEGEKQLAALKDGSQKEAADMSGERLVSRAVPAGLSADAIRAAFAVPADQLPSWVGVSLGSEGYQLIQVEKVLPPDGEAEKRRESYQTQVRQRLASSEGRAWMDALKSGMKIERKLDNLASSGDDGQ